MRHRRPLERIEQEHRRRAKAGGREPAHELPVARLDSDAVASRIGRGASEQRELVGHAEPLRPHRRQDRFRVRRRRCQRQVLGFVAASDAALTPGTPDATSAAEHSAAVRLQDFSTLGAGFFVHVSSLIQAEAPDR